LGNEVNRDELVGINMPRGSYALSGSDWDTSVAGAGAPMIINSHTPGIHGDAWDSTYGASHDSFLSLVDGSAIVTSIANVTLGSVYTALPNTASDNIWEVASGRQQIQYVVSGSDIDDGRSRIDSFGALEDARGLCVRMPAMACGYGKTKEMLPLIGNDRENPDFIKVNRDFWKTGSLEARWDATRSMWATYNDLIVDHQFVGLGTAVHSTNGDDAEGFPYLKGRLQDVWWVRQPLTLDGSVGKTDGTTTAEIMTHLEHKFYDDTEEGAAKLSSIFIVPHKSLKDAGTPNVCHEKGEENTLGGETTGVGASIDIKTEAHFWKDVDHDGPIRFGDSLTELGNAVCCENTAAKFFIGEMIFLDDQPDRCDGEPPEAGPPPCEWVPAIRIDECQLMGGHMGKLVQNDIAIVNQLSTVCVELNKWSKGELNDDINAELSALGGIISDTCAQLVSVAEATTKGFADLSQQIDVGIGDFSDDLEAQLNTFAGLVSAAILACCEIQIDFDFSLVSTPHGFDAPKVEAEPCLVDTNLNIEFPCSNCNLVELQTPCEDTGMATFLAGSNCDTATGTTTGRRRQPVYTNAGDCQVN